MRARLTRACLPHTQTVREGVVLPGSCIWRASKRSFPAGLAFLATYCCLSLLVWDSSAAAAGFAASDHTKARLGAAALMAGSIFLVRIKYQQSETLDMFHFSFFSFRRGFASRSATTPSRKWPLVIS